MHPSVIEWSEDVLTAADVRGRDVLEVGAYDVNGSLRPYLESLKPRRYLGVDAAMGPGVDRVVDCERLTTEVAGRWDIVISTEMMEHVRDWRVCMEQLADIVKPGGLLLITTRGPGFPYHPFPEDHWRYTTQDIDKILTALRLQPIIVQDDTDPRSPGVFVLATKPTGWTLPKGALADIEIAGVTR